MENNVLSGGIEEINQIKQDISQLNEVKVQLDFNKEEEVRLSKEIKALEKGIEDEITLTLKKRKKEIEDAYDSQISTLNDKKKKIKDKRQKDKSKKVSERVKDETASLKEENRHIRKDIKRIFKADKIPMLANTELFYAIYKPKGVKDIMIILLTIIISLLIIPCSVFYLLYKDGGIKALVIIYFITVVFFSFIYLLLQHFVKEKHPDALNQVKQLRAQIKVNEKKMRIIKKRIIKDKDDSLYGLEGFDAEISNIEIEESSLNEEKKNALMDFTNNVSKVIADEIRNSHNEELEALKKNYHNAYNELRSGEDLIKRLTVYVATNYEPYLGKDMLKMEILDKLLEYLSNGKALTISEAIGVHESSKTLENNLENTDMDHTSSN